MSEATARSPDWDHLFEIAAAQDGLFTTQQAAEAGYPCPVRLAATHERALDVVPLELLRTHASDSDN